MSPGDISEDKYRTWLLCIEVDKYSGNYAKQGIDLFMYMWKREGFDGHRAFVIRKDMSDFGIQGTLLMPFVNKGYMKVVWAIFDKADPKQVKEFMSSEKAREICSILGKRNDDSLNKFLSYSSSIDEELSSSLNNVKLAKVQRKSGLGGDY
ncbi:hypothetical protein [Wolbachia endosymbiont of Tetranychus urticae]|uniref:hypothetical protein n=1 Tax=Wolbachia endosymbiont of Tetranychus urticae TaxID=169184 RepID=UPI003978EC22